MWVALKRDEMLRCWRAPGGPEEPGKVLKEPLQAPLSRLRFPLVLALLLLSALAPWRCRYTPALIQTHWLLFKAKKNAAWHRHLYLYPLPCILLSLYLTLRLSICEDILVCECGLKWITHAAVHHIRCKGRPFFCIKIYYRLGVSNKHLYLRPNQLSYGTWRPSFSCKDADADTGSVTKG